MLEKIRVTSSMIALESATTEQTLTASVERLPEFIGDVKDYLAGLFSFSSTGKHAFGADYALVRAVTSMQYSEFEGINVVSPPGLKVDFKTYLDTLSEFANGNMASLLPNVLLPFNRWLGVILTNPEKLQSFRNDRSIDDFRPFDVEVTKRRIADCFDPNGVETTYAFYKAYRSPADYRYVNNGVDGLIETLNQSSLDQIKATVDEIASRLNLLMEKVQVPNNEFRATSTVVKTLAETAYGISRACEMFSVFYYQAQAFATAVKDGNVALQEQLKKVKK